MKKLKGILFDHDGTLVDSEYTHYLHWKKIMKRYSVNFPLELCIKDFTGVPTFQNALYLINHYKLTETPEKLIEEKTKLAQKSLDEKEYQLMPNAMETVEYFKKKGVMLSVVSGSNHDEVVHSIDNHNMLKYFEFIVGGDDVEYSKPAPDVYLLALKKLGFRVEDCIAVEDTESGINAAKSAGLICIGVKGRFSATQDFSKADVELTNLNEAKKWINEKYITPNANCFQYFSLNSKLKR